MYIKHFLKSLRNVKLCNCSGWTQCHVQFIWEKIKLQQKAENTEEFCTIWRAHKPRERHATHLLLVMVQAKTHVTIALLFITMHSTELRASPSYYGHSGFQAVPGCEVWDKIPG